MSEQTKLTRFLARENTTLDQHFWNGFVTLIETRFGAIEMVLGGYKAATDALVDRGLTQVAAQLAAIVAELNTTVAAAQADLLNQVTAAQAQVAAANAAADAVAATLATLQTLVDNLESQIEGILADNNLPATGVTVATITGLAAANVQAALEELRVLLQGAEDLAADAVSAAQAAETAATAAAATASSNLAAHVALSNPHNTTASDVGAPPQTRTIATAGLAIGGGNLTADRTITVPKATASHVRAATDDGVGVTPKSVADAMAEVTLTDAATISWDMSQGFDFVVTLAGNRTLGAPTNTTVGKKGRLRVVQDATGSRTLSFNSVFKFAGGTAPVLSTAANAHDYLYYDVHASTHIVVSMLKDVK